MLLSCTGFGLVGISGQFHCKGELMVGGGRLPFLTKQTPQTLFLCKEAECVCVRVCVCTFASACGHARACYDTMPDWFWSTVCEEKTCIHLNCLIMLQDGLSMLNGPQTSCVYLQTCRSSHLTCSIHYSNVCISLLFFFFFKLAYCFPWPDT